jgi:hypothetical protein
MLFFFIDRLFAAEHPAAIYYREKLITFIYYREKLMLERILFDQQLMQDKDWLMTITMLLMKLGKINVQSF